MKNSPGLSIPALQAYQPPDPQGEAVQVDLDLARIQWRAAGSLLGAAPQLSAKASEQPQRAAAALASNRDELRVLPQQVTKRSRDDSLGMNSAGFMYFDAS